MRTAIISDIHANLEAFETVLHHIEERSVDRIICLGDVIGYGPDPCACIDLVSERCEFSLLGNHDFASLYEPTNFNPVAAKGSYWTRDQFEPTNGVDDVEATSRRQAYLHLMKYYAFLDDNRDFLLVHASPRKPITEYLFKEDVQKPSKLSHAFAAMPGSYAFVGHTHMPGIFTAELDERGRVSMESLYDYDYGNEIKEPFALNTLGGKHRFIVNPGSIGQPRDRDPRAGYAILETTGDVPTIEFIRLEYPIQVTCDKIHAHPELTDRLGDRLLVGE